MFPIRRALASPPPLRACAGFWSETVLASVPEIRALPPDDRRMLSQRTEEARAALAALKES